MALTQHLEMDESLLHMKVHYSSTKYLVGMPHEQLARLELSTRVLLPSGAIARAHFVKSKPHDSLRLVQFQVTCS